MPHPTPWIGFSLLVDLVRSRTVTVLSGAGVSTESGIPDYRGPETQETDHAPIRYGEFVESERIRRHYWARSAVGWPTFDAATPNPGHAALAALERSGVVNGLITQNVDRLHQEAGSDRVVELHGALADVTCLTCGALTDRREVQERLRSLNPSWSRRASALAPDGDAEIPWSATRDYTVPACRGCGGILKPNVVFFGENANPARVDAAWSLLEAADALLVVGSSLSVYSGFRFVRGAKQNDQPIGIVNLGSTRGTPLSTVHVEARTGQVLPALAESLGVPVNRPAAATASRA
jgi:NAD-dependent SIR2 family protein deacetylase